MHIRKRYRRTIATIGLATITFLWLLPIIWMIVSSLRDPSDPFYAGVLPAKITLANYQKVLANPLLVSSFKNSAFVAALAATTCLLISCPAAYGFSRYRFAGSQGLQSLLLIVRLFPAILLAITLFRVAGLIKIYDTHIPLIAANVLFTLPFATWNLRQVIELLPIELEEAAWIDGTNRIGGITKILFPLMLPGLVTTWAYVFILTWNEYLFAMSFIRSPEKQLITSALASNIGQYNIDFTALVAAAMLASIPLLALFLIIQRYIVSGLAAGAVHG